MASLTNKLSILSNGNLKFPSKPTTWPRFARIKHWHERYGRSYIAQRRVEESNQYLHAGAGGDPAVFQLVQRPTDKAVSLTPELEMWMKRLFVESSQGRLSDSMVVRAYKGAMKGNRAYTNFSGWDSQDGHQSVVIGCNLGMEPMKLQLTIGNGATIKVLGEARRVAGIMSYPIEVLNAQDPKTLTRTLKDAWWLIFPASNSTLEPAPEGQVDPFPYLGDYDVPIPLLANNTTVGYVEAGWVEFLGDISEPVYPYYRTWVSELQWKRNRGLA